MKKLFVVLTWVLWSTAGACEEAASGLHSVIAAQKVVLTVLRNIDDADDAAKYAPALRDAIRDLAQARSHYASLVEHLGSGSNKPEVAAEFSDLTVRIQAHLFRLERDQKIPEALEK